MIHSIKSVAPRAQSKIAKQVKASHNSPFLSFPLPVFAVTPHCLRRTPIFHLSSPGYFSLRLTSTRYNLNYISFCCCVKCSLIEPVLEYLCVERDAYKLQVSKCLIAWLGSVGTLVKQESDLFCILSALGIF